MKRGWGRRGEAGNCQSLIWVRGQPKAKSRRRLPKICLSTAHWRPWSQFSFSVSLKGLQSWEVKLAVTNTTTRKKNQVFFKQIHLIELCVQKNPHKTDKTDYLWIYKWPVQQYTVKVIVVLPEIFHMGQLLRLSCGTEQFVDFKAIATQIINMPTCMIQLL